jgi:Dolichyl-phosphate-mannose-protein mannosyltransferase
MTATAPTIGRPLPVAPPVTPSGPVQTSTTDDGRVTGRGVAAALALAVVAGAVLRLWGLGANRLGYDEAFTAMAGRMPVGDLLAYLRTHDSHPPLDYLLRAPLARAGVNEFLFRLPSVVCSVGALALFAWWMRRYGLAGIVATALLAVSDFQLTQGRTARMYAELELIGVLAAVLADSWLRRPRRWHAPAVGALVLVALLTHVQGFLLGGGLLALAGLRRDRESWRWRAAVLAGGAGWALLWGSSFLAQAHVDNSDWIPRTTVNGMVRTFGDLVTNQPALHLVALVAVAAGGVVLWRRDRRLARVFVCCAVVPAGLAAAAGTVAPVLIDRTLTVAAWGPLMALGFLVGGLARRSRLLAAVAIVALASVTIPAAVHELVPPTTPDLALRHLASVARRGDVVATRPGGKLPELAWSVGVRGRLPYRETAVRGLGNARGLVLGRPAATGRTWLLDWRLRPLPHRPACARPWSRRSSRLVCLR